MGFTTCLNYISRAGVIPRATHVLLSGGSSEGPIFSTNPAECDKFVWLVTLE